MTKDISRSGRLALATIASTALLAASAGIAYYGVSYFHEKLRDCQEKASSRADYTRVDYGKEYGQFRSRQCPELDVLK